MFENKCGENLRCNAIAVGLNIEQTLQITLEAAVKSTPQMHDILLYSLLLLASGPANEKKVR